MIRGKKIKIYGDGLTFQEIKKYYKFYDGFTFNPSLFKNLKIKNYLEGCKKIVKVCKNKPVSLEVFADNEKEMIRQAKILASLGKNIYVKIPIIFTNGKSTIKVLRKLLKLKIKLNITAIFTKSQISEILKCVNSKKVILSVFAGRIYDSGKNASLIIKDINNYVHKKSFCKVLWASTRMSYDIIESQNVGCDIITIPNSILLKTKNFGKSQLKYSQETVKMFYEDAKKSKFKI